MSVDSSQQRLDDSQRDLIPAGKPHLSIDRATGRLRCETCGKSITVDATDNTTEYGHQRGQTRGSRSRCPHRPPAGVDPQ